MNTADKPPLQPPGAGLPWWELLVARYIVFPRACRKLDWAAASQLFQDEGAKILAHWDAVPAPLLTEPRLIPRLRGMEDSSRFWSVAMTVEHLNIVGSGIRQTIQELRHGKLPNRVARTQDVKPRGETPPGEVRNQFIQMLADAKAAGSTEQPIPRGQGLQFRHPWFGPLDGFQWHCLLGIHQRIHRHQIEAIRKALGG